MRALGGLLIIAYPLLVWLGLGVLEARWLGLVLVAGLGLRWVLGTESPPGGLLQPFALPGLAVAVLLGLAVLVNDERLLMGVPVLVSAALLLAFGRTLFGGPTLVERIARTQVPDLPAVEVRYCRGVTQLWCLFFLLNGSIALGLALAGQRQLWALYTGLVSYLLIGAVFAAEFVVRSWRFGRYEGTPVEPLFRRLFARDTRS